MTDDAIMPAQRPTTPHASLMSNDPLARPPQSMLAARLAPWRRELAVLVLLLVVATTLALINPQFLSGQNLQNLARRIGMSGIFAVGLGFVIITGGIDLSVGSMIALLGILQCFLLVDWHVPWWLALPGILAGGAFLGLGHGLLITRLRLWPFVVTLCGLLIYRGTAQFIAGNNSKGFGTGEGFAGIQTLLTGSFIGVPVPFWLMLAVAIIGGVLLHGTVYGRHLYAVGHNEEAARHSGIRTDLVITLAYVLCGATAALSSILFAFDSGGITPSNHGNFYELYGIAAAVVAGCSLRGGQGSMIGIVLGVVLIQLIPNLVNLLGWDTSLTFAVMGVVILFGASADSLLVRRRN
jgi:ribose transport system permease protein